MTASHHDTETLITTVTATLRQVLAALDDARVHPDAAIHVQWAIDLLEDGGSEPVFTDPR